MKKTNKNIKAVMAVVALFVVFSVAVGVFMAARNTFAPADSTSDGNQPSASEQADFQQEDSVPQDNTESDNSSENGESEQQPDVTAQPTAEPEIRPTAQPAATSVPLPTQQPQPDPSAVNSSMYSAMWISYLEFQSVDFSTQSSFTADMEKIFADCSDMGIKTVIVQVRPFGDALYDSDIFPTSHLITGTQGDRLQYDPLEEMVKIAHGKGLRIEAWVNPYRVRLHGKLPDNISEDNPARDESLVFNVGGGVYYNPALEQVQDMVVKGIEEIVQNYDVDGIHLDDYFYNENADMSYDSADYAASGSQLSQEDWRRENVNTLVRKIYKAIKDTDSSVTFGISPQGNNDNNYHIQYSDVCLWMREEGYVDYIMPQLYWGFGYLTSSGREDYQFVRLTEQWAAYPRHSGVKLYIGMGAYRIGAGDGGANDQSEWSSGNNLMKMVNALAANGDISGFGLYRYDNLFRNSEYADLAKSEVEHLAEILE